MPEIINLISSSPRGSPSCNTRSQTVTQISRSGNFLSLHSDGSVGVDGGEFQIQYPSKRRRLSRSITDEEINLPSKSGGIDSFDEASLPAIPALGKGKLPQPRSTLTDIEFIDDIVFTSSAPNGTRRNGSNSRDQVICELSSDDLPEFVVDKMGNASTKSGPSRAMGYEFSDRTANILANISSNVPRSTEASNHEKRTGSKLGARKGGTKSSGYLDEDDILFSSQPRLVPKTTSKSSRSTTQEREERAALQASKLAEKEAEKERRQVEKEKKAIEKQRAADIAEVNKSRTNKKTAVPEMIIEMSSRFKDNSVGNQIEEYMNELDVRVIYDDSDNDEMSISTASRGKLVKWRRKVTAKFDEESGQWEPLGTTQIENERHILIYLTADEFTAIANGPSTGDESDPVSESTMKANLDTHVQTLRTSYENCIPIYLIEGLSSWLKKNQNAQNRAYAAAVRAQVLEESETPIPSTSTSRPRQRKKKSAAGSNHNPTITADLAEDLLLHLQVAHQPILIHHTTTTTTSAAQISTFTQHLATRPYRLAQQNHNLKSASFCMDSGQVRTGDDARDTYVKMLQEVSRVTPSMAYGIAAQWPTVRSLVQGFRTQGNLMLEDVRKSTNKDGGWSDRRLGPMVSRRLYKVFMGRDPNARDGMA